MDASQVATALLTEHLSYTPLSIIDDIIDSVNNLVYQGVGSLETGLFATPPERLGFKSVNSTTDENAQADREFPEAKQEIEEGLHKLETLLNSMVDKNFDKFEIYVLRNILSVPADLVNWIRLEHYEGIEYPLPENAPTPASIDLLRQKLTASRAVNKILQTEQRRNEVVLSQLKTLVGSITETSQNPNFSFLNDSLTVQAFGNQGQQPLTTNTKFTLSQLPAMKTVLAELREQLNNLKNLPSSRDTAKDELREERRGYIEQRTQAHIKRNGHASNEEAGAVGGKTVDPAEIEALEKVVASFDYTSRT